VKHIEQLLPFKRRFRNVPTSMLAMVLQTISGLQKYVSAG